jgi:K+-sensing histidine kinase KdpD
MGRLTGRLGLDVRARGLGVRRDRLVVEIVAGIGVAIAASVLRAAVAPVLGNSVPFVTFFPAVAVAAWLGGLAGGLSATVTGALVSGYFLLEPIASVEVAQVVPMAMFLIGSVVISVVGGLLHGERGRAQEAEARASFLADASGVLTGSLDSLETVEALARVAVPRFADWCAIDLVDEAGEFRDVRIAHVDPQKVDLGYTLRRHYPIRSTDATGAGHVVRSGEPEFVPALTGDVAAAIDDERLAGLIRDLGLRSYLCVPLIARGRRLGALSMFMADSGRAFTDADLAVARELAARAAVALDHARLFRGSEVRGHELDAVLRSIGDGVLVVDRDGRIESRNPAAEQLLGPDLPATYVEAVGRLAPAPGADGVLVATTTQRYVRASSVPIETDGGAGRVVILRDVTELLESQAARDAFLGMLSHELRTPITTIFGAANMLRKPIDPGVGAELMADLVAESDRLYRLVEDLLVLSRFERGRLEIAPEPVLLQRVLPRLVQVEEQRWPGVDIRLDVAPGLPAVVADTTYVEQIVRNLLSNAAKYGGQAGPITVRAMHDPAADAVRLEVEDQGAGIPEGDEDRIFKLYERLPDAARSFVPGAGIGLFVCRRLAELMGGTISVTRPDGGGARFCVTLPTDHSGDESSTDTDLVDMTAARSG